MCACTIVCTLSNLAIKTKENHNTLLVHYDLFSVHFNTPNKPGSNRKGYTPLTLAAQHGHVKVIDCLVGEHGIDPEGKFV